MEKVIITKSSGQTQKIAFNFTKKISKIADKKAIVVGLIGNLGSGKTTFAQGFAKGLGIKENITSPTFVLMKVYSLPARLRYDEVVAGERVTRYSYLIHIDAYRLEKSKDLLDLGFKNLVRDPKNIILIEWADRIKKILPKNCLKIKFEHMDKNKRKIWMSKKIK